MFPLVPLLVQLAIGIGVQVVGYLLMPKPKAKTDTEVKELDDPTAEGGRPIPVIFGEKDVKDVNVLWFGDKLTLKREI